jgi:hypothetical protein
VYKRQKKTHARHRKAHLRRAIVCEEGEHGKIDPITGGSVIQAQSRSQSRHVCKDEPLTNFHDDLRSGTYNIDQLAIITDKAVIAAGVASADSCLLQHVVT